MTKSGGGAGLDFENWARIAFKRLGFQDVGGGAAFVVGGHQVDCCAGWDDVLLVVACRQAIRENASIRDLIIDVRGKRSDIIRGFRKMPPYANYRRFEFAILSRNIRFAESHVELADASRPKIHLLDEQFIEYYENLQTIIGDGAKFNVLGELGIEPHDRAFPKLPSFQINLGKYGPAYLFWCDPHELLKIAYVARRGSGQENYYQRLLNASRIRTIHRYVDRGGVFPNSIIVAFDDKPGFTDHNGYEANWPEWLRFGELQFPKSYRSAWIIDGQHRLYSYGWKGKDPKGQKLAVFAFEKLSQEQQAKFFIDINHEQMRVEEDLILDLEGQRLPNTPRGRVANCVRELNEKGPLKGKIYLPLYGPRKRGQVKMSGLHQDLTDTGLLNEKTRWMTVGKRNPLTHGRKHEALPHVVATALSEFLNEISKATTARATIWNEILRPGGMTLTIRVYEQILVRLQQKPTSDNLKVYAKAFVECIEDIAPNQEKLNQLKTDLSSFKGRTQTTEEVVLRMSDRLDDADFVSLDISAERRKDPYGTFERKLAEWTCTKLGIKTLKELKNEAPEGVWSKIARRVRQSRREESEVRIHEELGIGDISQLISQRRSAEILLPHLLRPEGFANDASVMVALTEIGRMRAEKHHKRPGVGNKALADANLETFERLITSADG